MDNIFLGSERMTVDEKGRVGIPARFMTVLRAICPEDCGRVGITISPDYSIRIMPMPAFTQAMENLDRLNDQIEEERLLLNMFTSFADVVELDKQNRFKLSPIIMEECQIGRQVVVTGSRSYMQIFDEKVWREYCKRGLSLLGSAANKVARRDEPKPTVQYVINAGEAPAGGAPAR